MEDNRPVVIPVFSEWLSISLTRGGYKMHMQLISNMLSTLALSHCRIQGTKLSEWDCNWLREQYVFCMPMAPGSIPGNSALKAGELQKMFALKHSLRFYWTKCQLHLLCQLFWQQVYCRTPSHSLWTFCIKIMFGTVAFTTAFTTFSSHNSHWEFWKLEAEIIAFSEAQPISSYVGFRNQLNKDRNGSLFVFKKTNNNNNQALMNVVRLAEMSGISCFMAISFLNGF